MQVIEQEAMVLRGKVQSLESENEKLTVENKRLHLLRGTKKVERGIEGYIEQIATLEVELSNANKKIKQLELQYSVNDSSPKQKLVIKVGVFSFLSLALYLNHATMY